MSEVTAPGSAGVRRPVVAGAGVGAGRAPSSMPAAARWFN